MMARAVARWARVTARARARDAVPVLVPAERGSGSILAVAVMAATMLLVGILITIGAALAVKQRVVSAADAAALAAADTASGLVAGFPCDSAAHAAELNGAHLSGCALDGLVATVSAQASYLGFEITVAARAGPPGS